MYSFEEFIRLLLLFYYFWKNVFASLAQTVKRRENNEKFMILSLPVDETSCYELILGK